MSKRSSSIWKLLYTFATALLLISLATALSGQRKPAKEGVNPHYLAFLVTIKGSGSTEKGSSKVTWAVNRTYESQFIELDKGGPFLTQNMTDAQLRQEVMSGGNTYTRLTTKGAPVRVSIDDSYRSVTTENCPKPGGGTFKETTTITRTWKGADEVTSLPGRTGITKKREGPRALYNVHIPVFIPTRVSPMEFIEEISVTGKPTKKTIEKQSLSKVQVPIVNGILDYPAINHIEYQPLDILQQVVHFESGLMKPSEPVLKGVPESITVTVEISYRWTSDPLKLLPRLKH